MIRLQSKTVSQLFEATVNLELEYFISLLGHVSITDFGERVSINDADNNSMAFYFDNSLIFTVSLSMPEESECPIPRVERFYLNSATSSTVQ